MLSRRTAFRLVALLLGLLPLAVAEGTLRLVGWGKPTEVEDPFVGFTGTRHLFELNRATGRYEVPFSRRALFCEESFAATKGESEFRIFCLGGSTLQGRPYAVETSFTTWLELSLQAADPRREWQVINCGGVSYASYRLVPMLRELLAHQPDLFIIYTGHNEFLEDRTYHFVKRTPPLLAAAHAHMSRLRNYNVLRSAWLYTGGQYGGRSRLSWDADPLLDYRGGLEAYHRDDAWRDATIEHFRYSLRQMVGIARDSGIPVLLCNPVSNLKDTPPFKTELGHDLEPAQESLVQQRLAAASHEDLETRRRLALLNEILAIDPRNSRALYHLGHGHLELGQTSQAKEAFLRAKDEDICPLRMLEAMHTVLAEVAAEGQVPLVDIRQCFEERSPAGIPGSELLIDHVHPTIAGHQLVADELLAELARLGIVRPVANWQQQRKHRYRTHRDELPADYFSDAEVRSQGLRRWTSGRAFQAK